jgi:hypothetical protein
MIVFGIRSRMQSLSSLVLHIHYHEVYILIDGATEDAVISKF